MLETRTYRLPLPPSANAYWAFGALRSRNYRGGKVPLTREAKNFRDEVAVSVFYQDGRQKKRPLDGACSIACQIVWPDRRRRDSGNLPKQLEDALQSAGVVTDDVQFVDHHYWVDRTQLDLVENGFVVVTITTLDEAPVAATPRPVRRRAVALKGGA